MKKVWERRYHAFPPHYVPADTKNWTNINLLPASNASVMIVSTNAACCRMLLFADVRFSNTQWLADPSRDGRMWWTAAQL